MPLSDRLRKRTAEEVSDKNPIAAHEEKRKLFLQEIKIKMHRSLIERINLDALMALNPDQARKEVAQRYDFKGSRASIDFNRPENTLTLVADDNFKMDALWEIVQTRLVRRSVPVKNLTLGPIEQAANSTVRRVVTLQQGIPSEAARAIVKFIKDRKMKRVQAAIQGDQLRISSPSKDELQEVMRLLREEDFGIALQFGNYR